MFVKEEQPLNAPSLIVVNPSGKVMFVKEEQSQNAQSPIVINPSGKVMFVKEGNCEMLILRSLSISLAR